jgi:hypothetical protein
MLLVSKDSRKHISHARHAIQLPSPVIHATVWDDANIPSRVPDWFFCKVRSRWISLGSRREQCKWGRGCPTPRPPGVVHFSQIFCCSIKPEASVLQSWNAGNYTNNDMLVREYKTRRTLHARLPRLWVNECMRSGPIWIHPSHWQRQFCDDGPYSSDLLKTSKYTL